MTKYELCCILCSGFRLLQNNAKNQNVKIYEEKIMYLDSILLAHQVISENAIEKVYVGS